MSSLSPDVSRDVPTFHQRLLTQEKKLQKLMKDAKKKEDWENTRRINGTRLPHAAKVPVPQPPTRKKPVDPGEIGCCGLFRRRKLKKTKSGKLPVVEQPPIPSFPDYIRDLPVPVSRGCAQFSRTPLPPIGQKRETAPETEETKAMKAHQRKAEKKLRGTTALKKADLMITPNAAMKRKAVAWEIVETSAPVAPLRPPSQAAVIFVKEQDARSSSRMSGNAEDNGKDIRPASRGGEFRPESRCKLPPQTREEMLEKLREKELRSHVLLRDKEEKRKEKVTEENKHNLQVHYRGRFNRLNHPDGARRERQIQRLRLSLAKNQGTSSAPTSAPSSSSSAASRRRRVATSERELTLDEQIEEIMAVDLSDDVPHRRRR